jgi:uncharacterized glyoxalase superfamily protein PhnB
MPANRSIPDCDVIPELPYADVNEAADWLAWVFGFTVRLRIGSHRVQMTAGRCALVLVEGTGGPCRTLVRIADADAHHERAKAAGATIVSAPADHAYGERQYSARDIGGHAWTFSQTIADVDPNDWLR